MWCAAETRPVEVQRRDVLSELQQALERMRGRLRQSTVNKSYLHSVLNSMTDALGAADVGVERTLQVSHRAPHQRRGDECATRADREREPECTQGAAVGGVAHHEQDRHRGGRKQNHQETGNGIFQPEAGRCHVHAARA